LKLTNQRTPNTEVSEMHTADATNYEKGKWRGLMPKKKGIRYKKILSVPIARKVFKDLMREKTIVFAIFLQLFIILTSSIIITNANALFNPEQVIQENIHIGITGDNYLRQKVATYFENSKLIASVYPEESSTLTKFENGDIDAVLIVNRSDDYYPIYISLIIPKGDIKSSLITSEVKDALQVFENELRDDNLAEISAIRLDRLKIKNKSNSITTQVFEALYSILIPFLLLLPGVLLGGLIIDILVEEMETKTLNLLMIITTFRKYLFEILLSVTGLAMLQVLTWELLLSLKGIVINNLPYITGLILFLNFAMFIACVLLAILVKDKTRSQLIYSMLIILLFATAPIFKMNPIRVISRLAIGLETVPILMYYGVVIFLGMALFVFMNVIAAKKEW
jgi:ABC-type Na+ efflux pump permease subunit